MGRRRSSISANVSPVAGGSYADQLTSGQETHDRKYIRDSTVALTSGTVRYIYFTSRKTETVNNIRMTSGGTAAATVTTVQVGIYQVEANGDLTKLGETPNDATLLTGTSTQYTKALSAPVNLVAGQRYAIALLVVASTMPTMAGVVGTISAELFSSAPRIAATFAGQSALVSSVANASLAGSGSHVYFAVTP